MLIEKVLVVQNTSNHYGKFYETLNKYMGSPEILKGPYVPEEFHQKYLPYCNAKYLLIVFVEFSVLDEVSKQLQETLNGHSLILISFYHENIPYLDKYNDIFDFINTNSFNEGFFFNRLNNEISAKNRVSLLQNEVREFYEIGKSLTLEKDRVKLLEMIVSSSMNMTSSDAATIYLVIDSENGRWSSIKNSAYRNKLLSFVISKNSSIEVSLQASTSPITRESISGHTVITGKPVRIDDAYHLPTTLDYHHDSRFDSQTGYITKSILSIPMKDHENNVMGVIQLINKKKHKEAKLDFSSKDLNDQVVPYTYTDELIMNSLAGQAAVALENTILYRDMQNLLENYKEQNSQLDFLSRQILKAHEEERKRIAREIHDGPAQSVVNLSLKVELLKKFMQIGDTAKTLAGIDELNTNIRAAAKEIRTIIYDLKPSYLEDGLMKALENHFSIYENNTGLKVKFVVSGNDSLIEYYMSSTIYRIVQEALSNIYKHAAAQNVLVDFAAADTSLTLIISDDGKGFDTSELAVKKPHKLDGGFGLEGIRERIEIIKGSLEIKSSPGNGTSLMIRVPLSHNNPDK
ncbi:MAG: GAF domain-containing sensor histidine kinase [Clostridia bacterium]|nr:GAF domain-containing sensor histidine kinase [Clostridia bacterium]